jgi:hypothetical protein
MVDGEFPALERKLPNLIAPYRCPVRGALTAAQRNHEGHCTGVGKVVERFIGRMKKHLDIVGTINHGSLENLPKIFLIAPGFTTPSIHNMPPFTTPAPFMTPPDSQHHRIHNTPHSQHPRIHNTPRFTTALIHKTRRFATPPDSQHPAASLNAEHDGLGDGPDEVDQQEETPSDDQSDSPRAPPSESSTGGEQEG